MWPPGTTVRPFRTIWVLIGRIIWSKKCLSGFYKEISAHLNSRPNSCAGGMMGGRKQFYSWIGDGWSTIFCGGMGIFAQPPHSAHMWAPFAFIIIHFSFCKAPNCLHWRFKRENVCIRKSSLKLRIDERTFPTNLKFVRKIGFVTWWSNLHDIIKQWENLLWKKIVWFANNR